MAQAAFRHQDISSVPRGWHVRTVARGGHQARIAFPPGARRKGAGRLISILHPKGERNPEPDCLVILEDAIAETGAPEVGTPESAELAEGITEICTAPMELNGNPKSKTREQLERLQAKAVRFVRDVLDDPDKADEIEGMTAEEYADKKRIHLVNPKRRRKTNQEELSADIVREIDAQELAELWRLSAAASSQPERIEWVIQAYLTKHPELEETFSSPNCRRALKSALENPRLKMTGQLARAAAKDAGDRSMRAAHRTTWSREDYDVAVREYQRLVKKAKPNPRPRKNLDELVEAQRVYETFQGKDAVGVVAVEEPDKMRDDFAMLGWGIQLVIQRKTADEPLPIDGEEVREWRDENEIEVLSESNWRELAQDFGVSLVVLDLTGDKIRVTSAAGGSQLYFIGGKQDLESMGILDRFEVDTSKDFIPLGYALGLVYLASKAPSFKPTNYGHIFAEEGGEQPLVMYNRLQKRLYFVGGDYTIGEPGILN